MMAAAAMQAGLGLHMQGRQADAHALLCWLLCCYRAYVTVLTRLRETINVRRFPGFPSAPHSTSARATVHHAALHTARGTLLAR